MDFVLGMMSTAILVIGFFLYNLYDAVGENAEVVSQVIEALNNPQEKEPVMGFYIPEEDDEEYEEIKPLPKKKKVN